MPLTGEKMKTFKQRLLELKNLIFEVLANPPEEQIFIYYMYYDADNPLISQNIPNKLLF
jgi:hypothetical protein